MEITITISDPNTIKEVEEQGARELLKFCLPEIGLEADSVRIVSPPLTAHGTPFIDYAKRD